jgi:hypothetical protein
VQTARHRDGDVHQLLRVGEAAVRRHEVGNRRRARELVRVRVDTSSREGVDGGDAVLKVRRRVQRLLVRLLLLVSSRCRSSLCLLQHIDDAAASERGDGDHTVMPTATTPRPHALPATTHLRRLLLCSLALLLLRLLSALQLALADLAISGYRCCSVSPAMTHHPAVVSAQQRVANARGEAPGGAPRCSRSPHAAQQPRSTRRRSQQPAYMVREKWRRKAGSRLSHHCMLCIHKTAAPRTPPKAARARTPTAASLLGFSTAPAKTLRVVPGCVIVDSTACMQLAAAR